MLTILFSLIVHGSLFNLPIYWYVLTRIEGIVNFISYSSICRMHDPIGYHSIENQKSVKSSDLVSLIISMTCIMIYQGIAGQDVFTGCILTLPEGYYLSWLSFLVFESELFPITV